MTLLLGLLALPVLFLMNAFFVAAEYGLVTSRRTRIMELQHEGNRRARLVLRITSNPPRFIAALLELHVLSCIACLLVVVLCPWSFVFVENQRITTLGTAATLEKRFFRRPCMTCAQLLRSSTRAM